MIVQKTVRAKIVSLTKSKEGKLEREYANFQLALKGNVEHPFIPRQNNRLNDC